MNGTLPKDNPKIYLCKKFQSDTQNSFRYVIILSDSQNGQNQKTQITAKLLILGIESMYYEKKVLMRGISVQNFSKIALILKVPAPFEIWANFLLELT